MCLGGFVRAEENDCKFFPCLGIHRTLDPTLLSAPSVIFDRQTGSAPRAKEAREALWAVTAAGWVVKPGEAGYAAGVHCRSSALRSRGPTLKVQGHLIVPLPSNLASGLCGS